MTQSVAEKIKRLRKSKGLSQGEMAEKLHISQSAYARMESGESQSWATHIGKISEIFDMQPESFFTDEVVGTINTINSLSEKLVEQYEERIKELKQQVDYWKNKSEKNKF